MSVATEPQLRVGQALDVYLRNVSPNSGLIRDLVLTNSTTTKLSDSDDAYVASFLRVAANYRQTQEGILWWTKNKVAVKGLARRILLDNQYTSGPSEGLVRTFSRTNENPRGTLCYLIDCCEVYDGLTALAQVLNDMADSEASTFHDSARRVALGIANLYSEKDKSFFIIDTERDTNKYASGKVGLESYPYALAQIYPQLYSVPLGTKAQTQKLYDAAWDFFTKYVPNWSKNQWPTGKNDGFPHLEIGMVACMRGQRSSALEQLSISDQDLQTRGNLSRSAFVQELGNRIRLGDMLGLP